MSEKTIHQIYTTIVLVLILGIVAVMRLKGPAREIHIHIDAVGSAGNGRLERMTGGERDVWVKKGDTVVVDVP